MKTIILSLTLMYNAFCMGQKVDSTIYIGSDTFTEIPIGEHLIIHSSAVKLRPKSIFDSVTIYGNEEPVYHRKKDTVKVMILACDTSSWSGVKFNGLGQVYWDFGYSVRELHSTAEEFDSGMTPKELWGTWWEHISYLDENKKQLPKNIVVWQSKEIE